MAEVERVPSLRTLRTAPRRPPDSRIEDDANLPEDDHPWWDEEEPDSDAEEPPTKPKRPFWNR